MMTRVGCQPSQRASNVWREVPCLASEYRFTQSQLDTVSGRRPASARALSSERICGQHYRFDPRVVGKTLVQYMKDGHLWGRGGS